MNVLGGVEMVQWWEHLPLTAVVQVLFPDLASHVGWGCYWFSMLLWGFSLGPPVFLPSQKLAFQFDLETVVRKSHLVEYNHCQIIIITMITMHKFTTIEYTMGFGQN